MSNQNIIKLEITEEGQIDRAIEKRESGDIDGALSILFTLEKNGCKIIEIYAQIAMCYMDIGINLHATKYWFKYLAHCPKTKRSRAYSGLGACFYYLEHYATSGYYFERQISTAGDKEHEFDNVLLDYYDVMCEANEPEFSVCAPSEFADYRKVIEKGDELFYDKEYELAITEFSRVPRSSEYYSIAQSKISACKLYNLDIIGAIGTLKRLIDEDPQDKTAILNMLGLLITTRELKLIKPYFELAENLCLDGAESFKLATAYCDCGNHERARFHLEKQLENDRYDVNAIFLYGIACYNLRDFTSAKDAFSLCYRITLSPSAKYYIDLSKETMEDESKFTELAYVYGIPRDESKKRFEYFKRLLKRGGKSLAKADKKTFFEYLEWAFSFDYDYQEIIANIVMTPPMSAQLRKFFVSALLDPNIQDSVKGVIISHLIENGYNKTVGVVFSNIFARIDLLKAEFDKEKNELFTKAYALAFGKLAPIDIEKSYKIRDGAYDLYYALKGNGSIRKVNDLNALSATICVYSKLQIASDIGLLAKYFATTKKEIKNILDLVGE